MTARRTASRRDLDRQLIIDHLTALPDGTWARPEPWMRSADIAALVEAGRLERQVRREWDRQPVTPASNGLFGGAGVCQRRRLYIRIPEPVAQATPCCPSWSASHRVAADRSTTAGCPVHGDTV